MDKKKRGGYRDLDIFNDAYAYSLDIHNLSLKFPKHEMYELGSQIRRSSKSFSINIAEGYGRGKYQAEFIKFLVYALASSDEVKVELQYCRDLQYISEETHKDLASKYEGLSKRIMSFIRYLDSKS